MMNRSKPLAFLAACLMSMGLVFAAHASEPLNLVVLMTDDQGRWAMGAYGNREIHTPNMDRIAQEGALFTQAVVNTPVCSPARATFFSGRYPTELGITDWISPSEADEGLGLDAKTWAQALQRHGYQTALIGKWHLGERPEFHPTQLGFNHFMGFLDGGNRPMDPTLEVDGEVKQLSGPLPDILTGDALEFIQDNQEEPFALCLEFRAPHLPYGPVPDEDRSHYQDLDPTVPELRGMDIDKLKQTTKAYYASISSVDRNIGRVLNALEETGLDERTLVLFTSDHGYNEGRHHIKTKGNGPWMAGGIYGPKRPNMWETSILTPLAIRWPGVVEPGTRIDHPVAFVDIYRSILGMLNVPVPDGASAHGTDFSPLLRGEDLPERKPIFGQYDLHNGGLAYLRMIRTERYKYVRHFHERMRDELYDLQEDPDEKHNLIRGRQGPRAEHRDIYRDLRSQLNNWMQSIDDPLLNDPY